MTRQKWIILSVALLIMGGGAGLILKLKASQTLGRPGVKVTKLIGDSRALENTNVLQILLPPSVLDCASTNMVLAETDLGALPKDTSVGSRLYEAPDGFMSLATVVLMGTDRTSIHKPQFCLTGQGWKINQTVEDRLSMAEPEPYELPVMKLTADRAVPEAQGGGKLSAVYVYWFVSEDRITAQHWERMWWMATDLFGKGELQRWAYISFYSICQPGEEEATYERMKELMIASVPEFQVPAGASATGGAK